MQKRERRRRTAGIYIYFIGVLLLMFFSALLAWADFEAALFDVGRDPNAQALESLHCPLLMNRDEAGIVVASFANPSDRPRLRTVDARISHGFITLVREDRVRFELEAGEERTYRWQISPEDAAWGRLILVRLHVLRNPPLPARTGSCGVLVMNLPFGTGAQIAGFTIGAGLVLIAGGAALWLAGERKLRPPLRTVDYLTLAIAPVVLVALVFSILGFWMVSGGLLLLAFLLIVSIVTWVLR